MTLVLGIVGMAAWAQVKEELKDSVTEASKDSIAMDARMESVTITAQRPLVTHDIDRVKYDVEHDDEAKTITVLDMLRRVPYVSVDGEDNIKVKGSSAFKIYRNGRLDHALSKNARDILRTMPASMVKRVEVITEPGAREDAEGAEAILNIVLMDNRKMEGVTGSLSGNINTLLHPNVGANLLTQVGKFTAQADYGYGGMSKRETQTPVDSWTQYSRTGNRMEALGEQKSPGSVHYADVSMSYETDSLNLLSASIGGYFYDLNVQDNQHITMTDNSGGLLYSYDIHHRMPGYFHHSWNGRLDYEHRTRREGERWNVSYMMALTRQHTDNEAEYANMVTVPFAYTGDVTRTRERFTEHTLQLDWLRPMGKGHQMEVGTKYIHRMNRSRTMQELTGTAYNTDTRFRHRTQVASLYGDYIYRRKDWSARAGLRYEYGRMQGDGFHSNLHDVVPQLSGKWQINDRQSLKLSFTTNIRRPGIEYLNPAVVRTPSSVSQGNKFLRSSRAQSIYLIYSYMGRKITLNLAPAFKWSDGGIGTVVTTSGDVMHTTYANVLDHRRVQLEGYVQWKPWKGTSLTANFNMGRNRYDNSSLDLSLAKWSGFLYGYAQQELWWKLRLTVAGYGQIGREVSNVYGYREPWWAGTLSLQRSFLRDDRLSVRLSAAIPFTRYKDYRSRIVQGDYTASYHSHGCSRSFTLALTWRFGHLKAEVKRAETSIENDDIVGGITKGH